MLLLLGQTAAHGGSISPELAAKLEAGTDEQLHPVIVQLADSLDIDSLNAQLDKMEAEHRTRRVVEELRNKAETTQKELRRRFTLREIGGRAADVTPFWIFNGFTLAADAETIRELAARPDIAAVFASKPVVRLAATKAETAAVSTGQWNLDRIGAPDLWGQGFHGEGAVVAILDTGVDPNHPALAGKWRGGTKDWFDPYTSTATPFDDDGHGTGAMGLILGGDPATSPMGVAPAARWIGARIFRPVRNPATGLPESTADIPQIIASFQWALNPDGNPATADAPDVINCSWDLVPQTAPSDYDPVFRSIIRTLKTAGIAVVVAAGNQGAAVGGSSSSPGNYPESISVGSTGLNNGVETVSSFSSRGPTAAPAAEFTSVGLTYDPIYPMLTAPGDLVFTAVLNNGFPFVSGTSFSAPHVAGAIALLANKTQINGTSHPALPAIKSALKNGALDLGAAGPDNDYGYGRLNLLRSGAILNLIPFQTVRGDVNGDGRVTVADALLVLKAVVDTRLLTPSIRTWGDVYSVPVAGLGQDNDITIEDALAVLQRAVGLVQLN